MLPIPLRTLAAALALMLLAAPVLAAGPDLTLKRVLLSTGGVGYFEYEARVTGDAELTLPVRRDRVDDVMKSLVVYDDRGGIGTISLPGREPLRDLFRALPFGPEALDSPGALLTALRGAEVRIAGSRALAGRLVAVTREEVRLPGGDGTVSRHRLTLATADGLRQAILEDVEALRLADDRLQARLEAVLAALAGQGEPDRRILTLHTTGEGERWVRVAYVVEAPLWKTSYRLTLDSDGARGGLQGWAVLENLSGEDWSGIDLTVVSGNPVTFRQALYEAYYVNRPEVPVEVLGRVLPKVDDGTIAALSASQRPLAAAAEPMVRSGRPFVARDLALAESAPPPPAPAPLPPSRLAGLAAAESGEATTQVTFHYPGPVSLANGQSLLLPIINRAVPAQRLALYQPETQPRHPLAAVRLANDGATGLPPGILTLYERGADGGAGYVGDARLAALPAGQARLLSFAVDQKLTVDRAESQSQLVSKARVAEGLLQLVTTERATTSYTIAGAAREARRVVIEHPRRPGWELVPAPAGGPAVELGADVYRLTVEVGAGQTVSLAVTTERPRQERFELARLSPQQLEVYAAAAELPAELRQALVRLGGLQARVADHEQAVARIEAAREEVEKGQQRLRDNLQAVGQGSDIGRRYMAKLSAEEDRLEHQAKDLAQARTALDIARQTLTDSVKALKF
ncbi:MAG: DUF4139 domain-containing protein [Rhodospirillaceae bacterium]